MPTSNEKKVYLLGIGPGNPELMTLKAFRILGKADCILYDHLVNTEVLTYAPKEVEKIFVGKSKGCHTLPQEEINTLLAKKAQEYNCVVRLKGGDPFIFGRGGEEYAHLISHGFNVEIIPGITAAMGAACSIGLPLTHRDFVSKLIFITGHKKMDGDYSELETLSLPGATVVIYMGVTALKELTEALLKKSENHGMPIAIIENATTSKQRLLKGTLENIVEEALRENLCAPAVIVVGEVVSFLDKIEALRNEYSKETSLTD